MVKNGKILTRRDNSYNCYFYEKESRKQKNRCLYKVYVKASRGKKKRMCKPLNLLNGETSERLIQLYGLDEKIPVNLDKLLDAYGIIVSPTDFNELRDFPEIAEKEKENGEILGAVAIQNDDLRILYRKSDSRHRQKFTIAHELAHCCLNGDLLAKNGHIEYRKDIFGSSGDNKEKLANTFAGELLIPETALNKIYSQVDKPDISALANVFDVSKNVMRERLKNLGLSFNEDVDFNTYFIYNYSLT